MTLYCAVVLFSSVPPEPMSQSLVQRMGLLGNSNAEEVDPSRRNAGPCGSVWPLRGLWGPHPAPLSLISWAWVSGFGLAYAPSTMCCLNPDQKQGLLTPAGPPKLWIREVFSGLADYFRFYGA